MAANFIILLIIGSLIYCLKTKKINKDTIIEGIIIGLVSGICLSFATDINYRAELSGPWIKLTKMMVNKNIKYVSKNWANINTVKKNDLIYDVTATNIVSGVTVKFDNIELSKLPADLRYDITSRDSVK